MLFIWGVLVLNDACMREIFGWKREREREHEIMRVEKRIGLVLTSRPIKARNWLNSKTY